MPNFVAFSASVAELAHGEKSQIHSLSHGHPAYLYIYLMSREQKLLLRNELIDYN